jgi:hypothetical protein
MLHDKFGVPTAMTAGLIYDYTDLEEWDEYIGETGGILQTRGQKHWRDLIQGKGGRLYNKMRRKGAGGRFAYFHYCLPKGWRR